MLLDMLKEQERAGKLTTEQVAEYERRIESAPVASFRPEVWRLDLRRISRRKYGHENRAQLLAGLRNRAQQAMKPPQVLQPDEYLVDDLRREEYEIIII
jgi:hypothetical protein